MWLCGREGAVLGAPPTSGHRPLTCRVEEVGDCQAARELLVLIVPLLSPLPARLSLPSLPCCGPGGDY